MRSQNHIPAVKAVTGSLLAAALLFAPAALAATPAAATSDSAQAAGCTVTGGTLDWGVKESFRSYISGSIANGSWETSGNASYATPNFSWSGATGTIDPKTGTGKVSFSGAVKFTGHSGVLDLTFANPTLEFEGDGKAALLLDSRSTDMEGNVAVDATQEWVGQVTVADALAPKQDALTLKAMKTELTNPGAAAFAGFYEAGAKLDPITVTLQFSGCDATGALAPKQQETSASAPKQTATPTVAEAETSQVPWIPIAVGGVALLTIGVTGGQLMSGRKSKQQSQQQSNTAADSAQP